MNKFWFATAATLSIASNVGAQTKSWQEFLNGGRLTYSTAENPKAKGVEASFDYPKSWNGMNGKRPNIIYQVTSESGNGLELCNLSVRELNLPADYVVTQKEAADFFDAETYKSMVPSSGKFIEGAKTTIDGQPAAWINFESQMNRAGIDIRTLWIMYPVYVDKRLFILNCGVGDSTEKPRADLHRRYLNFLPLFQQMANSIVIHSKWKNRR